MRKDAALNVIPALRDFLFFVVPQTKEGIIMNKNKTVTNNKKKISVRVIAGCGMLVAVAVVLQYIEISIPIMPSFIKLDFSDLPELIGAFAYGPLFGVIISLLKNLIHMLFSQSGFVGELSNFILGAVFSFTAGIIYKYRKERKFALIAGVCGAAAMAIISVPTNYFLIYPMYYGILNFPEEAVLGMYQVILPGIKSIFHALLVFNLPFTFVKGLICAVISMFIYKPLTKVLKERP